MENLLKEYREINATIGDLEERRQALLAQIKGIVDESGDIMAHGVKAYYKAGRKSIDHEAACKSFIKALAFDEDRAQVADIIETYTTRKISVAWAKVTKEVGIDTSSFVTEGAPVFVVEVV